jgi:hypothetical protein
MNLAFPMLTELLDTKINKEEIHWLLIRGKEGEFTHIYFVSYDCLIGFRKRRVYISAASHEDLLLIIINSLNLCFTHACHESRLCTGIHGLDPEDGPFQPISGIGREGLALYTWRCSSRSIDVRGG